MTIIFGKKLLFALLLGLYLLTNILEITNVNYLGISTLLSFCTCILLPGFLISLILQIRKISLWENLLLILGLSLAFLEFGGLLLNILLPLLGINDPLAFQNLVIGFDIYTLLLFIFAWIRTKQITVRVQLPRRSVIEKVLYVLPVFFPILATLGAILLNNGGSNILTMILLGAIAFYILLLIFLGNKISVDLYPYALFFIGMACLFITSLRSWYISGHDIEREFYVFQLTNTHHFWNMAFYEDPYNACLSITILPTILTNLLSVQDMYIYKVIFQILFATAPVLVFFIAINFIKPALAFLSAFLFITFPPFYTDMAMLNRQEIGFIFFGLLVYMTLKRKRMKQTYSTLDTVSMTSVSYDLTKIDTVSMPTISFDLSLQMRRILFVIFGIGIILSHYSTNFVLLGSIILIYVTIRILSLLPKYRIIVNSTCTNNLFLSLPLIIILFGMTYFWNNLYTHASGNHVSSVASEVINSIFVHSNNTDRTSDLSNTILFAPKPNPDQQLQNYIQTTTQSVTPESADTSQLYSQAITTNYPTYLLSQEQLPPTLLGMWLSLLGIPVFSIQNDLKLFFGYMIEIFVFIGLLFIIAPKIKKIIKNNKIHSDKKNSFDLQFLLFCFSAFFLLALITVLPSLSLEYGVLRMFQQFLFFLSIPILLGFSSIFFFVKEQKRILFAGIIIILLFLNLTGFFSHLTGEYLPVMYLDNSGLYYECYYVRKADVFAIVWLSENYTRGNPIEADETHGNIILDYGHIFASNEIIPQTIPKNGYMFVQVSNNLIISGGSMIINVPQQFLDDNKNLIYSNGGDNIYR